MSESNLKASSGNRKDIAKLKEKDKGKEKLKDKASELTSSGRDVVNDSNRDGTEKDKKGVTKKGTLLRCVGVSFLFFCLISFILLVSFI
jgi:hypothetical protein